MTRRSRGTSRSEGGGAGGQRRSAAGPGAADPLVAHGWRIFLHPLLVEQVERLMEAVEAERARDGEGADASQPVKILDALVHLMFDAVPQDPSRPEYRQGDTLGAHRKHWFRAKFGNSRYRLFFRFRTDARVIVFAWVNDERSLRTYGSRDDVYAVFRRMLDRDNPPDGWDALLAASRPADVAARAPKQPGGRGRTARSRGEEREP